MEFKKLKFEVNTEILNKLTVQILFQNEGVFIISKPLLEKVKKDKEIKKYLQDNITCEYYTFILKKGENITTPGITTCDFGIYDEFEENQHIFITGKKVIKNNKNLIMPLYFFCEELKEFHNKTKLKLL